MLDGLGFAQQALVDRQLLPTGFLCPDPIAFCVAVRSRSFGKVVGIVSNVSALGLCWAWALYVSVGFSKLGGFMGADRR